MTKKDAPGKDFGKARAKFGTNKIGKALQMRAEGYKLKDITQATGLSMSYVSRLTRHFLARGAGRVVSATSEASLSLLQARLKKLENESRLIRDQIKKLTGGGSGKPGDAPKGKAGAAKPSRVDPAPRLHLRKMPPDAAESGDASD